MTTRAGSGPSIPMAAESRPAPAPDAMAPLDTGPLIEIRDGSLVVAIAPQAGGRIAQIRRQGVDHLVGHGESTAAVIAWGSFPMVPWAGRIREGHFGFQGRSYQLLRNLGSHAIHGFGFAMPWSVTRQEAAVVELALSLPQDESWPFGGSAQQRLAVTADRLEMTLSVRAGRLPMPAVIGWHPWFRKPDRMSFSPAHMFPRDEQGIATLPLQDPLPGPWDDCFINHDPVLLELSGQQLRLSSDCQHWVVYDATAAATCIEPQSGPPDAFNLTPATLEPGTAIERKFLVEWL